MKKVLLILSLLAWSASGVLADWGYYAADRSWVSFSVNGGNTAYSLWDGTGDWYDPAANPSVVNNGTYHGSNLGTFDPGLGNSLTLTSFDMKAWKNDGGDLQNCHLQYAITLQGVEPSSGDYSTLTGGWLSDISITGGTTNQLWGAENLSTDLLQGLGAGNYNLHVYGIINDTVDENWYSAQNNVAAWQGATGDGLADNNGVMDNKYTASFSVTSSIPEPASLMLLGLGSLALWFRRRR